MIRRLHDPKHATKLLDYGRKWHAKSILSPIPVATGKALGFFKSCMLGQDTAVWASFDRDGKVKGVLVGCLTSWPYLEGSFATDLLFVAELDGRALYRAFEQWATAHGANSIQMGVSSGLAQANVFYKTVGLKQVGGIYFNEVAQP